MDGPGISASMLSVATLRAIVENASDGIFVTDTTLAIEWVNDRACDLLGFSAEELVGKRIMDFIEPSDVVREPIRQQDLAEGRPTMTVRRFRMKNGESRVLEVSATAIGEGRFLGIARDATERLRAQDRLARSEASFRAMIEASPDGVVVHRGGRVVYINAAGARMLGETSPEPFLGTSVMDLMHPDDRPKASARILAMMRGEPRVPFADERLVRRDGGVVMASIGAMPVMFEGEPAIVAVARDVTSERRLQEQLAHADRLASLGTLAAGIAHEINNPLAYVLLHLDGIQRLAEKIDSPDGRTLGENAAMAAEGARRVARIVRDLRAFSRFDDDDANAVTDVRQAIDLAVSTASHELKHRARVVLSFGDVPPVKASKGRLAQIFLNLILNAGQAIREGHPDENRIEIATAFDGGDVRVSIRDTGVGMGAEIRRRLFEPFFTTKHVGEGTGLGLAICHGLVTALGGRISVESTLGEGSTFTVALPPATTSATTAASPAPSNEPTAARMRVLVVDDEVAICEAIARNVRSRHDVVTATSALAAQAMLENDDGFDAIVCDIVMPGRSGLDLYTWIRENKPALAERTMFMTGGRHGDSALAVSGVDERRLLYKPFDVAELESFITEVRALAS